MKASDFIFQNHRRHMRTAFDDYINAVITFPTFVDRCNSSFLEYSRLMNILMEIETSKITRGEECYSSSVSRVSFGRYSPDYSDNGDESEGSFVR